ncbi:MAG: hypothetical protein KIG97_03640 [Fibrobacter sp.]|uniref:FISUMP domain-containing protein n=1 Tax=Fibrobacter sp. TaxID=35828 RepID=UPI0025BDD759|nr:FISUMP domain-containing protein [Fibrobacter sp.]MBS7271461.1 hypothetical protein [Fibrobacter sp.]
MEGKPQFGSFTDIRDGQKYKCFKLGGQIWMAENLRYEGGWANEGERLWDADAFSEKDNEHVKYTWAAAMNMPSCMNKIALPAVDKVVTEGRHVDFTYGEAGYQGLAPMGWRIPSVLDFEALCEGLSDKIGFNEAEHLLEELFIDEGSNIFKGKPEEPLAKIWTVNEYSSDMAYAEWIGWGNARGEANDKSDLFAVRCIKNAD